MRQEQPLLEPTTCSHRLTYAPSMLPRWLALGLVIIPWTLAINCGGNATDRGDGRTGGGANDDGSAGFAARAGSAGAAGSTSTGGTGLAGSGSIGSGGSGMLGSGGTSIGGSGGFAACALSNECAIRSRSCCGDCGGATRSDVIALARGSLGAYSMAVCGDSGCPACFRPQDPTLSARCENGSCAVVDLLSLPLTACQSNADCRLRTASCCECGGNVSLDALIAIRRDSELEFQKLVCDGTISCDACVPPYPEMAKAACHGGRCTVTGSPGTTPI